MLGDENEMMDRSVLIENRSTVIPFFKSGESGIINFQNLDCSLQTPYHKIEENSSPNPFYECEMISSVRPIDLVYFNSFRVIITSQQAPEDPETMILRKYLYFPSIDFSVQQIRQPFKLVSTPLTKMLAPQKQINKLNSTTSTINAFSTGAISQGNSSSGNSRKRTNIKFGFMTLDQNQRICPFMASDPISQRVPLIGVWISGVQIKRESKEISETAGKCDENYLIWSILVEFVKSENLAQRYSYDKLRKNFLLILFHLEENPQFFEVEIQQGQEDIKNKVCNFSLLKNKEYLNFEEEKNLNFEFKEELMLRKLNEDYSSNKKYNRTRKFK
jgi:hypothetical protein